MTEGVDIPSIDFLLLARPTRSSVLLQQMLGRGMRLYLDKDFCLVMDFVDVFSENMMSATVPTLLGLIEIDKKGYKKSEKENPSRNRVDCKEPIIIQDKLDVELSPFINPFDFKSIEKDVNHIKAYSQLPWLRVGQKKWILNMLGSKNFIKLEYCNKKNLYIGKNVFRNENYITRDKVILSSDQFDFAIKGLDTFAKNNSTFVKLLQTYSEWRKLPITDRQRQLLMKWRIKFDQGISKGDASDLITRRLHGALSASLKKTREAKSEK
jgi:ATP-dependent helicase IRC3